MWDNRGTTGKHAHKTQNENKLNKNNNNKKPQKTEIMSNTELYYVKQQAIKPNIEIISVSYMVVMITYWHILHQSWYHPQTSLSGLTRGHYMHNHGCPKFYIH